MQTIRTPEKRTAVLDALQTNPSRAAACRKARISKVAFYAWIKDDPEFKAAVDAAIETGLDALEDSLIDDGLKGDTTARIFLLKARRRSIYGDRSQLDVNMLNAKAEKIAGDLGIDPAELMAEAQRLASDS